jgi:cytosine deaminase
MAEGADVVGGIPWIEFTEADQTHHIDQMFAIARENDADVAMLTDDAGDPGLRTTEELAVKTIETGWEGRVTACHARAMELYPEPYRQKLYALLERAEMDIVTDPQTGPLHVPVDDLLAAGIPVSIGQDDIADAYYPFGQNDMLEVGFLAAHLLWKTTADDLQDIYRMLTHNAAASLGIDGYGLTEGTRADLVVFDVDSIAEAFHYQPTPTHVVSGGDVVAETTTETTINI